MQKKLSAPFTKEKIRDLRAGDSVLITRTLYTARDEAHMRMLEEYDRGTPLPFDIVDAIVYYVGPSPARPGQVIGSAGPTSSYRMDPFAPRLLEMGMAGMIGKGPRSPEVIEAIKKSGGVYFAAIGGAGALISKSIKSVQLIAYEDLGTEAVRKLEVEDFPAVVAVDPLGNDLYAAR
ncbi:MAG: Fe-S-containing hydro-lyase [Anaerovoracaceae bacterium]|nr:Fe-S-containing hydro-lyase [Anaerovoracaceae bacterium]